MSKDETAKYLKGIGYDATVEEGVVVIWVEKPMTLQDKNVLRRILQSVGYRSSWSWRIKQKEGRTR